MKIIIASDSYKGTVPSVRIGEIVADAAKCALKEEYARGDVEIAEIAISDGGEGALEAIGCQVKMARVKNPDGEMIDARYGRTGKIAFIESANANGYALTKLKNPEKTTTYGVGQLILSALDDGARDIYITLGGSSTNDLGCGMAAALGVRFFGRNGEFVPTGASLGDISHIDMSGVDKRISECRITALCDVDNPLLGENGAAYVYARQKGADDDMIVRLEEGAKNVADLLLSEHNIDIGTLSGSGAAGGMGGGIVAFFGGRLKSGFDAIAEIIGFDEKIAGADLIITGEGYYDSQSARGKVVSQIAQRAHKADIPCIAIVGGYSLDAPLCDGLCAIFSIQNEPKCFEEAIVDSEEKLYRTAENIIRVWSAGQKGR